MITKQEILEDFWEQFPQYKEMTPTYEDILFREEEIKDWNDHWLQRIFNKMYDIMKYDIETLEDLEKLIILK